MELYLDSVNFDEIEEAFRFGFLTGLTTTPTFMYRQGIKDIDGAIIKLSKMVPILQIEALGDTPEEILAEAERQLALGLDKETTVFKIPVSNVGIQACKLLCDKGYKVNIHLVYTLNQAYMAMAAGATYVCPLVGRLQDQGHDAISLIEDCVEAINHYGYDTKIMFSSVRHPEHIRKALKAKVHTITVPWKVMKVLTHNNFTDVGTQQFVVDTQLMTQQVREAIAKENPVLPITAKVFDALTTMTESGLGAVSIVDEQGELKGIFTDGYLRRKLKEKGKELLEIELKEVIPANLPVHIEANALLIDAVKLFKEKEVDNIIVVSENKPIGMVDIQDFMRMNLIG